MKYNYNLFAVKLNKYKFTYQWISLVLSINIYIIKDSYLHYSCELLHQFLVYFIINYNVKFTVALNLLTNVRVVELTIGVHIKMT